MSENTIAQRTRYHRHLEHGNFSLEANTEAAPEPGQFYLLQQGKVLLCSDDFGTAEAGYRELCRAHWERDLVSDAPLRRMASAWGLLGLELTHRGAAQVVEQDGVPADQVRLTRMRSRARAMQVRDERIARLARAKAATAAAAATAAK